MLQSLLRQGCATRNINLANILDTAARGHHDRDNRCTVGPIDAPLA
jgi:hypothetical protein